MTFIFYIGTIHYKKLIKTSKSLSIKYAKNMNMAYQKFKILFYIFGAQILTDYLVIENKEIKSTLRKFRGFKPKWL